MEKIGLKFVCQAELIPTAEVEGYSLQVVTRGTIRGQCVCRRLWVEHECIDRGLRVTSRGCNRRDVGAAVWIRGEACHGLLHAFNWVAGYVRPGSGFLRSRLLHPSFHNFSSVCPTRAKASSLSLSRNRTSQVE